MKNSIREVRFFKNMTQVKLASEARMQPGRVSLIENGAVDPRWDEKLRLSEALGVSEESLFQEDPAEEEARSDVKRSD